jgi:hypothetical protein
MESSKRGERVIGTLAPIIMRPNLLVPFQEQFERRLTGPRTINNTATADITVTGTRPAFNRRDPSVEREAIISP